VFCFFIKNISRKEIFSDFSARPLEEPGIVEKVVTWITQCEPVTKCQQLQWRHPEAPRLKNVVISKSKVKTKLIFLFLISKESCVLNLFFQNEQSTKRTTSKFWNHTAVNLLKETKSLAGEATN
jgi:hypothetical protein